MLVHLHVKNLALIEESEVEFGPGLNILTGETGAGKSILLGSIQLILGGKTSRSMIRENASYALVELLFQVENTKARESLAALDIYPEDGQVLMSRKIMDGRSINKINGETSTVSQMKAAAACLLDIHGQHEHQSLLYGDRQLAILDVYGKEQILPAREKVRKAYQEYRDCVDQLKALDMDEEQRNREKAFLEFEINDARLNKSDDIIPVKMVGKGPLGSLQAVCLYLQRFIIDSSPNCLFHRKSPSLDACVLIVTQRLSRRLVKYLLFLRHLQQKRPLLP